MGWKANCILVTDRPDGQIGTDAVHDSRRAVRLARQLGLGRVRPVPQPHNCFMVYPRRLCIGAYEHAAVISFPVDSANLVQHPGSRNPLLSVGKYFDPRSPETARLLETFPGSRILCLMLHSAVNQFGYAVYEQGRLKRARIGDSDFGVFLDEGDVLPEEVFARSIIRDEFCGQTQEFLDDAYGEEFVFELSRRFFGSRLDEDSPDEKLTAEEFERVPWWSFWE